MTASEINPAIAAGFKYGTTGPHNSRTAMMAEISRCLDLVPVQSNREVYRVAIVEENILGKRTESTRKESFRRLRELYGLDYAVPIFRIMRDLDLLDPVSRPLLSLLTVCARDPLLRATAHSVLDAAENSPFETQRIDDALAQAFPEKYNAEIRAATARHLSASWSQAGFLTEGRPKIRARVDARPAAMAMSLMLSTLENIHGPELFSSFWPRMIDLNAMQAQALASQAHREGLVKLLMSSGVVEVSFPRFSDLMKELNHESLPSVA